MTKRASADRPGEATSFRLRVTIERRLSSSALLVGSAVTRLSASNLAQLILVAYHKELGLVQYLHQKMVVRRALLAEFRGRIDGRIDLAAQQVPRAAQGEGDIGRR